MRTASFLTKSLCTLTAVLVLLGWSATTSAAPRAGKARALAQSADASSEKKPDTTDASSSKAEAKEAPAPAGDKATTPAPAPAEASRAETAAPPPIAPVEPAPPVEVVPEPGPQSVVEVGVERLRASAYPEPLTRGLPYGSLSLTFHGLQWPYMPARGNGPRFVIGLSGWGWIDNAIEKFGPWGEHPDPEGAKIKYWKQQSRLLLRVTPTYAFNGDWFIQGQAEIVATGDQTITRSEVGGQDTDDLFLRIGQWNKWDFMVGRYEGWEVFHLGMGLDQNTFERSGAVGREASEYGIGFYGLTDNQFRPSGAAGNVAFHYYPLRILRFELLGMTGSLSGPAYATRPVAILDLGWLKLKAGTEYRHEGGQLASQKTSRTHKGIGGALQFVFLPHIELGLNAAQGTVMIFDNAGQEDRRASMTRTSYGGFANLSNGSAKHPLLFGLGAVYTHTEDQNDTVNPGMADKYWLLQSYAAVQYVAFQQLYIKLVGGYSRGHWLAVSTDPPITFDDDMYSLRLRFAFYF